MARASLLDHIRDAQQRLVKLREETAQLEAELAEATAALMGTATPALPALPRRRLIPDPSIVPSRKRPIQPNSSVDWAVKALKHSGEPMETEALIKLVAELGGPVIQKPTLVSNLSRYIKNNDTFSRVAPNTYGLIEWDKGADELFGVGEDDLTEH